MTDTPEFRAERRARAYAYALSLSSLDADELTSFEQYLHLCREIADAYIDVRGTFESAGHWLMFECRSKVGLFRRFTRVSKGMLPNCLDFEDGILKTIDVFAHCRRNGYRPLDLPGINPPVKNAADFARVQNLARTKLGASHPNPEHRKGAIAFEVATLWRAGRIATRKDMISMCRANDIRNQRIVDEISSGFDDATAEALRIVYSKSNWHAARRHERAKPDTTSDTLVQRPEGGFRSLADLSARKRAERAQRLSDDAISRAISKPNMDRAKRYEQARQERAEAARLQRQAEREQRQREHEKTQAWKEARVAELIRKGYGNAAIREKAGVPTYYNLPPEVMDFTRPLGPGGHHWSERMEHIARAMRRAMKKRVPAEVFIREYGLTRKVFTYALRFNAFNQVAPSNCVRIPRSWKAMGEPLYDTSADTPEHARGAAATAAE